MKLEIELPDAELPEIEEALRQLPRFVGYKSAVQMIGEAVASAYEKATGRSLQSGRPIVLPELPKPRQGSN